MARKRPVTVHFKVDVAAIMALVAVLAIAFLKP